ncbi:MAG: hypothetical protein ACR2KV_09335 [Solirubrobacteraceae bacterium]
MSAIEDVKSAVEGALGKVGGLGGLGELPPAKLLAGARVAIGAAGILVPGITAWVTGLKPGRNPSAVYLVRLNGASNAALGAGMLAGPAAAQPLLIQLGLATDVVGLLATKRARKSGKIGMRAAIIGGVTELALAGLGGAVISGKV